MIPRRTLLTAAPLALAACSKAEEAYFGRTDPPRTQRLVYLLGAEPGTLDPAKSNDLWEAPVIHGLFEGLTSWQPSTREPVAALGEIYALEDPSSLLNMFGSSTAASGTGWSDPQYDVLLGQARTTADASARMQKLAGCERFLLHAMPCMPLYSDVSVFLCKPFVKGLVGDPFHGRMFNDIWIDTNWRPS